MKLALAGLVVSFFVFPLSAPRSEDSIVFAVVSPCSLRKTFDTSLEMELDDVSMILGEQELPEEMTGAFAISFSRVDTYVVVDEYVAMMDGRPGELVRRFETLERHEVRNHEAPGTAPVDEDETEESKLVGHALRFTWNDEAESYDIGWEGEAGDRQLLEALEEDMDLRALLPARPVSVDDTWELPGKTVLDAIPPGGRLGFPKKDEDDEFDFEVAFEGSAEATYAETREEDGVRLAVIAIELKGEAELPARELENGGTQSVFFALDVECELLWNLAQDHAHSMEVVGGLAAVLSISNEVEANGETLPLEIEVELSGAIEMSAAFERR